LICTPKSRHESSLLFVFGKHIRYIISIKMNKIMSKRIFTKTQIELLQKNPNVDCCSERSIGYQKAFKISAVKEWEEGIPPLEIFIQAGFDANMIGKETPNECLFRWRKIYKEKGEAGLKIDGRGKSKSGGRPKTNWENDKDKIKYLEAKVEYLKAENDFLAKLRKKR